MLHCNNRLVQGSPVTPTETGVGLTGHKLPLQFLSTVLAREDKVRELHDVRIEISLHLATLHEQQCAYRFSDSSDVQIECANY